MLSRQELMDTEVAVVCQIWEREKRWPEDRRTAFSLLPMWFLEALFPLRFSGSPWPSERAGLSLRCIPY